jgi:hypothetical protein
MTIGTTISLIIAETIGGLIKNLPYFILVIWGIRTIAREMPKWITQMFHELQKAKALDKALDWKKIK